MVSIGFLIFDIFVALLNTILLVVSALLTVHHYHKYFAVLAFAAFGILCMVYKSFINIKRGQDYERSCSDIFFLIIKTSSFLVLWSFSLWWYVNTVFGSDKILALLVAIFLPIEWSSFYLLIGPSTGDSSSRSNLDRNNRYKSNLGYGNNMFNTATGLYCMGLAIDGSPG